MSKNNYIYFEINGRRFDIDPEKNVPTIDYALEDDQDFEQKKSAEAFGIELPATVRNTAGMNTAHVPGIVDNTPDSEYDKPQAAKYVCNGQELLIGKFFYQGAKLLEGRVTAYTGKLYGLNGDWVIDLKDKSLHDFLNPQSHILDADTIRASWNFDGRSEVNDFVYAPVRYVKPFGDYPAASTNDPNAPTKPDDTNAIINDMKPSLSVYWLLYRAFKSAGYRIVSKFMDTDYYRRGVLPWVWGGFDLLDSTQWEQYKFLAKMNAPLLKTVTFSGYRDYQVLDTFEGAYDTSNTYQYPTSGPMANAMVWTYPASSTLGKVVANLSVQINYDYKVSQNSDVVVRVEWYKNGVEVQREEILSVDAPAIGSRSGADFYESFYEGEVVPGDYIACRIFTRQFNSDLGECRLELTVEQYQLNFFKLATGSPIKLQHYSKFKNYKILDLLRGEIDLFDLTIQTDPARKEVYIEPTHRYMLDGVEMEGYFNRKQIDRTARVDHAKESVLEIFSDYEREFTLRFKDDGQDGGLKKLQDRNQAVIGTGKYLLPERYKTGKKELENRFYAPSVHVDHEGFKFVTGIAPQLLAIVPENISNTSSAAAENVFQPKRAYYKGNVAGVGGWRFNGEDYQTIPFMFSVNYKAGGENDPVLSYGDQIIGGKIAPGLIRKFYLQRFAIYRYGRRWNTLNLRLYSVDVANFLHRESLVIDGIEYALTHIRGFDPMSDDSTPCTMWMIAPITDQDSKNIYPSVTSLRDGTTVGSYDVKYWPAKLLSSDLPK